MTRRVETVIFEYYNVCERCGNEFRVARGKEDVVYCPGCAAVVEKELERLAYIDEENKLRRIVNGRVYGVKLGRFYGNPSIEAVVIETDVDGVLTYMLLEIDDYSISIEDIPKAEADELLEDES